MACQPLRYPPGAFKIPILVAGRTPKATAACRPRCDALQSHLASSLATTCPAQVACNGRSVSMLDPSLARHGTLTEHCRPQWELTAKLVSHMHI